MSSHSHASERGATLTGYALLVALLVVVSLAGIQLLEESSGEVLTGTADQVGDMRPTLSELSTNAGAAAASAAQNPPPGPAADIANPPAPQSTPAGFSFQNINYQSGYSSEFLDLVPDPALNAYQDDDLAFLFNEGGGTPPGGFTSPNSTGVVQGPTVCSMYLRFSPRTGTRTLQAVEITVPGPILGYASSESDLDQTDTWLGGNDPAGSIGYRPNRGLASGDLALITVSDTTISIPKLTSANTDTDELRIFYNC